MWWIETAGLDDLRLDTFPYVERVFGMISMLNFTLSIPT
jgi:hypothetical protein